MQPQHHGVRPLLACPLDDGLADPERAVDREHRLVLLGLHFHRSLSRLVVILNGGVSSAAVTMLVMATHIVKAVNACFIRPSLGRLALPDADSRYSTSVTATKG